MIQKNEQHFRPGEYCEHPTIQILVLSALPTATFRGAIVMVYSFSSFSVLSLISATYSLHCRWLLFLITLIDTNTLDRTPLVWHQTVRGTATYTRAASRVRNHNPRK